MSNVSGTLAGIALRSLSQDAPERVQHAVALAGLGLEGDRHADPVSPRQVLLAEAGVYRDLGLAPLALRENLLADLDTARLASGSVLRVGEGVLLRVMFQCEACGSLDRHRPGLARQVGARRGVLARVLTGGRLRSGDPVTGLGPLLPAWPEDWQERVRHILDAVPADYVIEYRSLARLAGLMSSYCRAFPGLIRRLGPAYAGKAVAAGAAAGLPRWHGAGLYEDERVLAAVPFPSSDA